MKNYLILFIIMALLMLIMTGCVSTENKAVDIEKDSIYQLRSNNDVVICACDITHDGVSDTIEIDCSGISEDAQAVASVMVISGKDNNVINIMDLAIPHMGWNACYLSVIDDKCYFVEYNPSHSQGYIHDYIKVFYVDDDGKEIVYDRIEYNKEMDIVDNVDMELSLAEDSEMNLFDERKEYYLSSAVCLISTNGGELKFYGMQTYN